MANIVGAGGKGFAERRSPHDVIFEEIVPSSGWTEDSDCRCLIVDLPGFKKDEVKPQVDNYGHLLVSGERQVDETKHIRFQQSYRVPDNSNIEDTTAKFEDEILYIIIPKIATAENQNNREKGTAQTDHIQEENQQNDLDKAHEVLEDQDKIRERGTAQTDHTQEENQQNDDQDEIDNHQRPEKGLSEEQKQEEDYEGEHAEENARNESSLLETLGLQLKKNKGIIFTAVLAFSFGVLVSQKFQTNPEN